MPTKLDLFDTLPVIPFNSNKKILLLTHTDMDGSGPAVILKSIMAKYPHTQVDVKHCNNGFMSNDIENAVTSPMADEYDFIVACDISCTLDVAERINNSPNAKKFVLLDHHETAKDLNKYNWACVESGLVSDSFRAAKYAWVNAEDKGHSSGTSLLYDYLTFNGYKWGNIDSETDYKRKELFEDFIDTIATYDTWDWVNVFNKEQKCLDLNTIFSLYGSEMFEDKFSKKFTHDELAYMVHKDEVEKMSNDLLDGTDRTLLKIEENKINAHLDKVPKITTLGRMTFGDRTYNVAYANCNTYLNNTFEKMKELYPEAEVMMINYGTGISFRSNAPDVDISKIVAPLGGGGHIGAGGVKIKKDLLIGLLNEATKSTFEPVVEFAKKEKDLSSVPVVNTAEKQVDTPHKKTNGIEM